MEIFPIQIALFISCVLFLSYFKYSIRYICIFLVPFTTMGLSYLDFGTTLIKPVQVIFLVLLIWFLFIFKKIRRSIAISVLIMLAPFLFSVVYNIYFFVPVEVLELEQAIRDDEVLGSIRTSLNVTNFTRMVYLIFGMLVYAVFSSIKIDLMKFKKIIDASIICVSLIGLFQVMSWHGGFYDLYEVLFYPSGSMHQQTSALFGFEVKRINATFFEPSFFGYYCICTILFYLVFFGKTVFLSSVAMRMLILVGILSTATTFVWGGLGIIVILYFFYTDQSYKIVFYVVFLLFIAYIFYFISVDVLIDSKGNSLNMRWYTGWILPSRAIVQSPFFGYALGTGFPQFIYMTIPMAIGFLGMVVFLYGLLSVPSSRDKKLYMFGILWLGIGNFQFASMEMWLYLGLLSNPLFSTVNSREMIAQTTVNARSFSS